MEKITDGIFISGKTTKADLTYNKIKYCINLSGIPIDYKVDKVYKIADDYERNDPKRFIAIVECIDKQVRAKNTPILIMCHAGMSRSPIIAALYLFYSRTFQSFDEALEYVVKKSKIARPNPDLVDFIKRKVVPLIQ
jgi:hypothetical protein